VPRSHAPPATPPLGSRNTPVFSGRTIPAGFGPLTKLPVGISLDGPPNSDTRLLAIGRALANRPGRTARRRGRGKLGSGGSPMTTLTVARRYLTEEQIATYHRDGYVAVPRVLDADTVQALGRVTDAFVERSRAITRSDSVYDLDPRHSAAVPVLRRIKNPADHDALYRWVALESPIPDIVTELIGPSIQFHHSKLNLKGSRIGAPVEVHQDAAFYPHSNDDVLAVGLLLDDATADNGALAVLPGSHRGPIHSHYDAQGSFVGCMRREDIERLDRSRAPLLTLPAGSIHIHHYRLVHWSAPNMSTAERRLLINAYSAADAVSLMPDTTGSSLFGTLVRGTPPRVTRRTAGDMPLPPDFRKAYTSIYELQSRDRGQTLTS
jgi:ectoine hydroxylase